MCGRFVSSSTPEAIAEHFGARPEVESLGPNYNVAPTNDVYGVVAAEGALAVRAFHWGLIPKWAKERKIGQRMINARAETLAEKPAFKAPFRTHRCIVPMDGFYEWRAGDPDGPLTKAGKPVKQPLFIHRRDGAPLAVAGLWAAWKDPEADPDDEAWLHSLTIVTTSANETMAPIHDRMPVILDPDDWHRWLDPANRDIDTLSELLVPASNDLLVTFEVSTDVNSVRNQGPHLVEPR